MARHAGVGVGTVYRRFPDKASLAGALFDERIDALITLAEQARDEPDAWAALVAFLERSAEMLTGDRGLRQLLMFAAHSHDRALYARDRMRPALTALLERAQAAGQVRADIRATDIPVIELMISAVADYTRPVQPMIWRRYLALMLDALRPAGARPLPEPPLSPDELVEVIRARPLASRRASGPVPETRPLLAALPALNAEVGAEHRVDAELAGRGQVGMLDLVHAEEGPAAERVEHAQARLSRPGPGAGAGAGRSAQLGGQAEAGEGVGGRLLRGLVEQERGHRGDPVAVHRKHVQDGRGEPAVAGSGR